MYEYNLSKKELMKGKPKPTGPRWKKQKRKDPSYNVVVAPELQHNREM
jgi:hypothetical protein